MGRRIDAFFGKNLKKSGGKFRATASLAVSRVAVLKKQRHARCSIARSDVLQLLHLSHHQRALLRVEQVIKEQNMLDVLLVVEGYCYLLLERVIQLEHQKDCPDELKEAISSLIFAASRCGDFPELQELQVLFSTKFGKEFTARAVDLRNNCGVNPKMIQKLSTRTPSYESRLMVLKEIAQENNITLKIDDTDEESTKGQKYDGNRPDRADHHIPVSDQNAEMEVNRKYKDVADAAQAAFESAAYAAAAARAAVELSRYESGGSGGGCDCSDHSPHTPSRLHKAKAPQGGNEERDLTDTEDVNEDTVTNDFHEDKSPTTSARTKPTYRW
ncbi:unnamed protein product [Cuscuta epithymum]|uniref:IST1-like protein n=1 Tax=Cuscuta epithymum TaxID=186058 RepID=A0AAV0GJE3_9ASTE|nr:unnamed protein product [Cuscuta epithymum]CAH9148051.1 unnamed protein product [Cuscuta epithymum]